MFVCTLRNIHFQERFPSIGLQNHRIQSPLGHYTYLVYPQCLRLLYCPTMERTGAKGTGNLSFVLKSFYSATLSGRAAKWGSMGTTWWMTWWSQPTVVTMEWLSGDQVASRTKSLWTWLLNLEKTEKNWGIRPEEMGSKWKRSQYTWVIFLDEAHTLRFSVSLVTYSAVARNRASIPFSLMKKQTQREVWCTRIKQNILAK